MGGVLTTDAAIPAAAHLVGPGSIDVLRAVVEAAGGFIESSRPCNVQYRPGHDATVRYTAQVSWNGAPPTRETLIASTSAHGTYPGTAVVSADTRDGRLDVGVWRWPFDPVLAGLEASVTASSVAPLLGSTHRGDLGLEVVAYRPTDRAVVRVRHADRTSYLKVVPPHTAEALAERHRRLRDAGVPAPNVRHVDERGILVLDELAGTTFRELIKTGCGVLPGPEALDELADGFAAAGLDGDPAPSVTRNGMLHAAMLATVMPAERHRLDELTDLIGEHEAATPPTTCTIHGDLHEGQLVVRDGAITGVIDVDDAGPGDPIDDRANLIAHLRYRAVTTPDLAPRLTPHADALRTAGGARFDGARLDVATAAALVGLATGPFRIQQAGWRETVADVLAEAERIARSAQGATRRNFSSGVHGSLTDVCT